MSEFLKGLRSVDVFLKHSVLDSLQ